MSRRVKISLQEVFAVFRYFYGSFLDRVSKLTLLKVGTVFVFFTMILISFASNMITVLFASFFIGFFFAMQSMPLEIFYSERAKEDPIKWMAFKEVWLNAGRMMGLMVFFLAFSFQYIFITAAISSLGFLFVKPLK